MGFLDRLRQGLSRTKEQLVSRFEQIVQRADDTTHRVRPVDVETIEALEELPGVSGKALHVAALALRVDRVEGQRGLARPA